MWSLTQTGRVLIPRGAGDCARDGQRGAGGCAIHVQRAIPGQPSNMPSSGAPARRLCGNRQATRLWPPHVQCACGQLIGSWFNHMARIASRSIPFRQRAIRDAVWARQSCGTPTFPVRVLHIRSEDSTHWFSWATIHVDAPCDSAAALTHRLCDCDASALAARSVPAGGQARSDNQRTVASRQRP